jgi:hypothetical protein
MKSILKAIWDFQSECPTIKKEKNNEFGKFKYTDLSDVVEVIRPLLKKHGLVYVQVLDGDKLVTELYHVESGDVIKSVAPLDYSVELKGMNRFQVMGSAISYIRKYSLCAILGIVSDEKSIDELKPETKKQTLSNDRFQKALESLQKGETTKERIEAFALTQSQKEELENVEI